MSKGRNRVELIGNLGKDPEIRAFQNGGRVANFSLATTETWKDKQTGEVKEKTEWHRISVVSPGLVSIVEKHLKKGSKVLVEGRLETRTWTNKKGEEQYTTEIVMRPYASDLIMLDSKPATVSAPPPDYEVPPPPAPDLDDSIPF